MPRRRDAAVIIINPYVSAEQRAADIEAAIRRLALDSATFAAAMREVDGLVRCPCCDGDGVIPRPWPSVDPDPVVCPTCNQAGRVPPQERAEWLAWHEEQA